MALKKSTIVRPFFRVLERAAPGPGAVLAERLWCTIPRGAKPAETVPGSRFTLRANGTRIEAEAWGDGPVVYLMHGWGGHRGQLHSFVAPLVARGHRVVAFDAPGHGQSAPGAFGPGRGLLTDFLDALLAVVDAAGPAHGVISHSFGAAVTTIAMLDGLPVRAAVAVAPVADPLGYTPQFAAALGFGDRIRHGFLRRLERRVGRPMADFDALSRARETEIEPLPALLVIHDRADREVPYTDGEALAMAWPHANLVTTTGLGHRRILHSPAALTPTLHHLTTPQPVDHELKCGLVGVSVSPTP